MLLNIIRASREGRSLRKNLVRFLTPTEFVLLEKRLAILVLLKHGASYKQIGRIIDVSPTTISFVKYNLVRNALRGQIRAARGLTNRPKPIRLPHFESYSPLKEFRRQQNLRRRRSR